MMKLLASGLEVRWLFVLGPFFGCWDICQYKQTDRQTDRQQFVDCVVIVVEGEF